MSNPTQFEQLVLAQHKQGRLLAPTLESITELRAAAAETSKSQTQPRYYFQSGLPGIAGAPVTLLLLPQKTRDQLYNDDHAIGNDIRTHLHVHHQTLGFCLPYCDPNDPLTVKIAEAWLPTYHGQHPMRKTVIEHMASGALDRVALAAKLIKTCTDAITDFEALHLSDSDLEKKTGIRPRSVLHLAIIEGRHQAITALAALYPHSLHTVPKRLLSRYTNIEHLPKLLQQRPRTWTTEDLKTVFGEKVLKAWCSWPDTTSSNNIQTYFAQFGLAFETIRQTLASGQKQERWLNTQTEEYTAGPKTAWLDNTLSAIRANNTHVFCTGARAQYNPAFTKGTARLLQDLHTLGYNAQLLDVGKPFQKQKDEAITPELEDQAIYLTALQTATSDLYKPASKAAEILKLWAITTCPHFQRGLQEGGKAIARLLELHLLTKQSDDTNTWRQLCNTVLADTNYEPSPACLALTL